MGSPWALVPFVFPPGGSAPHGSRSACNHTDQTASKQAPRHLPAGASTRSVAHACQGFSTLALLLASAELREGKFMAIMPSVGGGFFSTSLFSFSDVARTIVGVSCECFLLRSCRPPKTFVYVLRRRVRNFKNAFSVRLVLDPHLPLLSCLPACPATAHQNNRFLPRLLKLACSRLWPLCHAF